jgi:hypothetical protein
MRAKIYLQGRKPLSLVGVCVPGSAAGGLLPYAGREWHPGFTAQESSSYSLLQS